MTKEQEAIETLIREYTKLAYHFTTQSIVLGAVLTILNQEIPDLKDRLTAVLESSSHPSDVGQAMIDEALDYVRTIR